METLDEMDIVLALDPLSPLTQSQDGIVLAQMGRMEEGRDKMHRALDMDPTIPCSTPGWG